MQACYIFSLFVVVFDQNVEKARPKINKLLKISRFRKEFIWLLKMLLIRNEKEKAKIERPKLGIGQFASAFFFLSYFNRYLSLE